MSYTKGEWKIKDEMHIDSETGLSIATVFWNNKPYHTTMVPEEEGYANIKLIAAAPELLEACIKAMDECVDLIGTEAGKAIEAAIEKATK